jgi:uncharacterized phiE125 gp8 family phage protein
MTTDYTLTTKEKVKGLLGISGSGSDALIDRLIKETTAMIETMTGRRFIETTYTEIIDGAIDNVRTDPAKKSLVLENYPITAWTKLEYKSGTEVAPVWNEIDRNNYAIDLDRAIVRGFGEFPRGWQNLKATYDAGYLIDFTQENDPNFHTLPFDLTHACTSIVAGVYNRRTAQGIATESTEGQSITWASETGDGGSISKEASAIIEQYTRLVLL